MLDNECFHPALQALVLGFIVGQQGTRVTPISTRLVVLDWEISANDSVLCNLCVGILAFDQETRLILESEDIAALHVCQKLGPLRFIASQLVTLAATQTVAIENGYEIA